MMWAKVQEFRGRLRILALVTLDGSAISWCKHD